MGGGRLYLHSYQIEWIIRQQCLIICVGMEYVPFREFFNANRTSSRSCEIRNYYYPKKMMNEDEEKPYFCTATFERDLYINTII